MTPKQQINQIRLLIKEELQECSSTHWPTLCALKQKESGLEKIERMVIQYLVDEEMPIGSALALIEQEMQHQNED